MSHQLVSGFDLDQDLMNGSPLVGSSKDGDDEAGVDEDEDDELLGGGATIDLDTPVSQYLVGVGSHMDANNDPTCYLETSNAVGSGEGSDGRPTRKRFRGAGVDVKRETDLDQLVVKDLLQSIHHGIMGRLKILDKKVEGVSQQCKGLEQKMTAIEQQLRLRRQLDVSGQTVSSTSLVNTSKTASTFNSKVSGPYFSNGVKLMTLNSEEDFPDGSWLGDFDCPHRRVRCHITTSDLKSIEEGSHTPEKMALTLLDFLFDRETQACSNISGQGKQGKKQLDPLIIFGIRCHLQYKFGTGDKEWQRIKTNLDSKCRTAHRRKVRGMPLMVKAFKDKVPSTVLPHARDLPQSSQSCDFDGATTGSCVNATGNGEEDHAMVEQAGDFDQVLDHRLLSQHHFPIVRDGAAICEQNQCDNNNQHQSGAALQVSNDSQVDDDDPCSVLLRHVVEGGDSGGVALDVDVPRDRIQIADRELDLGVDILSDTDIDQHAEVLRTLQGDIRVLHATPEQIAEIQRSGRIQILTREDFLGGLTLAGAQVHTLSVPPELKGDLCDDVGLDSDDGSARHPIDFL